MLDRIKQLMSEVEAFTANSKEEVEAFRIKYSGKKGLVNDIIADFRDVPNEMKRDYGRAMNMLKNAALEKVNTLKEALEDANDISSSSINDTSRPGEAIEIGARHPISIVKNQIIDIFSRIGFNVSEGPEIEDDWHNFTALNLPEYHPARDCKTHSLFRQIQMCYYVHIPHRYKYAIWRIINLLYVLYLQDVYIVMKR